MESTGRVMKQPSALHNGDPEDKEFMTTLAKGLAVLGALGKQRPTGVTLSEAAQVADLSRATARRVLRLLPSSDMSSRTVERFRCRRGSLISASLTSRRRAGSIARCP